MTREFARRRDGLNAHVCKDVPPKYKRIEKPISIPNTSKYKLQKIILEVPDEYAFALMEKYKKGLRGSIMMHIRATINPVDLE